MEKEIQVPEFVNEKNEQYKINREVQRMEQNYKEFRKIKKINFIKNSCRKVLVAAALAGGIVVAAKSPMIGKIVDMVIEYDNAKFNDHNDTIKEEVYENTGRTISEELYITENPNLTSEDVINNEKGQSYH